jgi:hypothetical protein
MPMSERSDNYVAAILKVEHSCQLQGTLHDQQAQPFPEFVTRFRQQTDLLKSMRRMRSDRGNIHAANTGDHGVTPLCLTLQYQLSQECFAYTVADTVRANVN